jgi:hypothetical protein
MTSSALIIPMSEPDIRFERARNPIRASFTLAQERQGRKSEHHARTLVPGAKRMGSFVQLDWIVHPGARASGPTERVPSVRQLRSSFVPQTKEHRSSSLTVRPARRDRSSSLTGLDRPLSEGVFQYDRRSFRHKSVGVIRILNFKI